MTVPSLVSTPAQLLTGGRVVTPAGVQENAWVQIDGDQIVTVSAARPDADLPVHDLEGAWLLPGFIDLHMHGGGGYSVADSPEAMAAAVAFHRRHGTTATLVSLMTAPLEDLRTQLGWAAELTTRSAESDSPLGVLGSHLEGPFLSEARCGAQNHEHMLAPDLRVTEQLLDAAAGTLAMMTLAPELPGALELIPRLTAADVIVAIGHSDATYEQAMAAFRAGARQATHLFNAMSPLHHRAPGLVGAVLEANIPAELINDGIHLHPGVVSLAFRLLTTPILITDAIDATGVGDGDYVLGGQAVTVTDGIAQLSEGASLAGSTLTMDRALAHAVQMSDVPIEAASRAASGAPADVLGIADRVGAIAAGQRADLVVMDDTLALTDVIHGGRWQEPSSVDETHPN